MSTAPTEPPDDELSCVTGAADPSDGPRVAGPIDELNGYERITRNQRAAEQMWIDAGSPMIDDDRAWSHWWDSATEQWQPVPVTGHTLADCPAALDTPDMRLALEAGFGRACDQRLADRRDRLAEAHANVDSARNSAEAMVALLRPDRPRLRTRIWNAIVRAFAAYPPPLA